MRRISQRPLGCLAGLGLILSLGGCHSAFVQATLVNRTAQPLRIFELDYPSASFGGGNLAAGATFRYRFKVLGEGPIKLTWTDAAGHDHAAQGPQLEEGEEGSLAITISPAGAAWETHLQRPAH